MRCSAHARVTGRSEAAGSASTNVAPAPASAAPARAGRRLPRRTRGRSRVRARCRDDPSAPRSNGSKIRSRSAPTTPGPRSRIRTSSISPSADTSSSTRSVGDEYLRAFSKRLTRTRSMCAPSTCVGGRSSSERHRYPVGVGADLIERVPDQRVRRPELRATPGGPGIEPREVEEILHEPLEPHDLTADRLRKPFAIGLGKSERATGETIARRRIAVRGERRS